MKIFISHSSKDKWAARRISEDIEGLGVATFLDEKDIKTGVSIDTSIKQHLAECDDFLIILSPASIRSEWVLIELGGAMALGKNVIPILLYVGANDIPQAINLRLARDINDVGQYYFELSEQLGKAIPSKKPSPKKKAPRRAKGSHITIGSVVRIPEEKQDDYFYDEGTTDWVDGMNKFQGAISKVTKLLSHERVELDIDSGEFVWACKWLVPINI